MAGTKKEEGKVYSENWGGIRENSGGTRAGAGRPVGSGTGRKYKTFSFSCSPEEYEQIKAKIEASGLTPPHFFVKMCLG